MGRLIKKIFLTGASGFIGKNIVEQLNGIYEIHAPKHQELDLENLEQMSEYLKKEKFDVVIHTANINTTRNKKATRYDSLQGNLRMFYNLENCRNYYGKMLYLGSGAEYSMEHYVPNMKEDFLGCYIPKDPYGFSKYIMSKQTESCDNIYELRLFGVYGKYEEWERRFISNAICRMLCGLNITISQNVYFDYIWIDDLVEIIKWFIENKPKYKQYNVCRGQKIDLLTLARMIKEIGGSMCDIEVGQPGFKREYTGDNSRMLDEMVNFKFTDYDVTIKKLISFYKEHISEIDITRLV